MRHLLLMLLQAGDICWLSCCLISRARNNNFALPKVSIMYPFEPAQMFAPDVAYAVAQSVNLPQLRRVVGEHVAKAVQDPRLERAERILMGGSGDSLFAAVAVAPAFRRWAGVATEARTAMELSRYETALLGARDLVISISNSGSSSRARESVLLAKDRGALTLGVTGSLSGALARQADLIVHRPVNEQLELPKHYGRCLLNFAEYLAVLYALYSLGLALGVRRGHISEQMRAVQLSRIETAIEAQGAIAMRIEAAVKDLSEQLDGIDTIWAIGAGPSQGTAQYCAAKFHEQMPINGISGDLEEWAHLEYFLTLKWGARSVVMVIAPPGNSIDRAQELVQGITGAGGRAIVVRSAPATQFPQACLDLDLGFEIDEWLSPLTYHLPAQMLVLHMAARAGIPHIPLRRQDGTWLIAQGIVRDSAQGLS
jgi:glutamine---fructose-6-phosphate transaminase (isomerizing)